MSLEGKYTESIVSHIEALNVQNPQVETQYNTLFVDPADDSLNLSLRVRDRETGRVLGTVFYTMNHTSTDWEHAGGSYGYSEVPGQGGGLPKGGS